MKLKKGLAVALTATMAFGMLTGCGSKKAETKAETAGDQTAASGEAAIETIEDGVLKVAMECGYAPYNWTQPSDENGAVPISGSSEDCESLRWCLS